ncbi:hypothetical protein H6758_03770 [Candidatus Nomurabacteria bacterium]|nr:hypothetical protein [Candidatus Nomurabacteria bacterium]
MSGISGDTFLCEELVGLSMDDAEELCSIWRRGRLVCDGIDTIGELVSLTSAQFDTRVSSTTLRSRVRSMMHRHGLSFRSLAPRIQLRDSSLHGEAGAREILHLVCIVFDCDIGDIVAHTRGRYALIRQLAAYLVIRRYGIEMCHLIGVLHITQSTVRNLLRRGEVMFQKGDREFTMPLAAIAEALDHRSSVVA